MKLQRTTTLSILISGLALAGACGTAGSALAQEPTAQAMKNMVVDPEDPRLTEFKEFRKKQLTLEKELKKLRGKHFSSTTNPSLRTDGLTKLKTYRDAWMYQSLIAVFQEEQEDVRDALIEIFTSARSDAGDRGLMWLAIAHPKQTWRSAAIESLAHRTKEAGKPTPAMVDVASSAVVSGNASVMASAGETAAALNIFEIIPLLIQAGGGGGPGPGGSFPDTVHRRPLAWVAFATQTAYVSNLRPAAGQGTIGLEPTIGFVNSGNLLVINDAVVTQAKPRFMWAPLPSLGSALSGQKIDDLAQMGPDVEAWKKWYEKVGAPALAKRDADFAKAAADKAAAEQAGVKTNPAPAPAPAPTPAPTATAVPATPK